MVATATPNRLAPYLSEPQKPLPPLPTTPEGRQAVLSDAVFAAVLALQGLLTHSDPKVVMRAAEMILNLETTRQRHGRTVIGTGPQPASECSPTRSTVFRMNRTTRSSRWCGRECRRTRTRRAPGRWCRGRRRNRPPATASPSSAMASARRRPGDGVLITPSEPRAYTRTVLPPSPSLPPP